MCMKKKIGENITLPNLIQNMNKTNFGYNLTINHNMIFLLRYIPQLFLMFRLLLLGTFSLEFFLHTSIYYT